MLPPSAPLHSRPKRQFLRQPKGAHGLGDRANTDLLLLRCGGDGSGGITQLADAGFQHVEGEDRLGARAVHFCDRTRNLIRRPAGFCRKLLHFRCDDCEPLAGFTGARGLDGGVERQQVRLPGDGADKADHFAHARRRAGQAFQRAAGFVGLLGGAIGDLGGTADLLGDFAA